MPHPAQPHAAPRVAVGVQPVIKVCISAPVQLAVQEVRHSPVREHVREADIVLRQVAGHAVHAVERFARKFRKPLIAAVMLAQVLDEQRRAAVVWYRVARLVRPVVKLHLRVLDKDVHEARLVPRNLGRHLGHALVHPHVLADVQVPVDGMLELVRQHAEVLPAAGAQPIAVHDYHLALVAVRVRGAGVRVAGREVARGSDERRVQHGEARVAVNARFPYVADGVHDWRADIRLEDFRSAFKLLRGQFRLFVGIPVCVPAHRK